MPALATEHTEHSHGGQSESQRADNREGSAGAIVKITRSLSRPLSCAIGLVLLASSTALAGSQPISTPDAMAYFVKLCMGSHAEKADFDKIGKAMKLTRKGAVLEDPRYDLRFELGTVRNGEVQACDMRFLTEDNNSRFAAGVGGTKGIYRFDANSYGLRRSDDWIVTIEREKASGPDYVEVRLWADAQK